ncbi:MAG: hypothetical protein M5U12_09515 [Verrucomicrobia bacterium]|nr:hypothetical protein [Verrucomicrobiota bacterium]
MTLTEAERAAFLARVRPGVSAEDYRLIEGMSHALPELLARIEQDPALTLRKLRHLLFGPKTEKTDQVCPRRRPRSDPPRTQAQAPRAWPHQSQSLHRRPLGAGTPSRAPGRGSLSPVSPGHVAGAADPGTAAAHRGRAADRGHRLPTRAAAL